MDRGAENHKPVRGIEMLTGYPGLACAILVQAAKDAQSSNGVRVDALLFLKSDGAAALLAHLGDVLGCDLGERDLRALVRALENGG